MALLLLSGCLPPLPPLPTLLPTAAVPTSTPTPQPVAAITATVQPTVDPNSLRLGQPLWIGRGQVQDAVFLPGAKQVAIAWSSGISLVTVATGQELWFQPTPANVTAFDLQPQAQALAAALADGSVLVFNILGDPPQQFKASAPDATSGDLAWSPDGKTIAVQYVHAAGSDPITLLNPVSGEVTPLPDTTRAASGIVPLLIWSPDGSMLTVTASGTDCPRLVDAFTGAERMALGSPGQCYSDLPLAWSEDGKFLAVPWQNEGAVLLNYPKGDVARYLWSPTGIGVLPGAKRGLFIDPFGQWIASRGGISLNGFDYHQPLIVWNLASGAVAAQIAQAPEALQGYPRMAATFDGSSILILYQNGQITRWLFPQPAPAEQMVSQILAMPAAPWTLGWSADGSRLAFGGRYGGVDIWDPADKGQLVRHFDAPLTAPALSPDGSKLALFDPLQKTETIYDIASGSPVRSIAGAAPILMGAAFAPDGRTLAYTAGGQPCLADLSSTRVAALIPSPDDGVIPDMTVTRLIWAPDGQALVTVLGIPGSDAAGSGLILLWKRSPDGSFAEIYHAANVQASYEQSYLALALFNRSGSRAALQAYPELGSAAGQALVVYDLAAQKEIRTLPMATAGAWVNDEVLLLSSASNFGRLERLDVLNGATIPGSGLDRVNAYDPTATYYMHEALTNARGIVIMQWQESDTTKIMARGIFETNGLAAYGWSPNGKWAYAIGKDGSFRTWPVENNQG